MTHEPLPIALAGFGRMGAIHALHIRELQNEGHCRFAAAADADTERARRVLRELELDIPVFGSVEDLARAGLTTATVVVTPTPLHREHATALIAAGHRVLLE